MSFNEKNIPQFDAYNQNELDAEEKKAFEEKLAGDPVFKAEFDAFNQFEKAIENAEIASFKANLSNWDAPKEPSKSNGKIINLRILTAVAAVALIGFLAVTYFFQKPSNQDLAIAHFTPYDNVLTVRGAKEDIDAALLLYEQQNYTEALVLFNRYPENDMAVFYAAESYTAIANYPEAVTRYETLLKKNTLFNEISTFHLALAYLGQDNAKKALSIFEGIPADSDYYQEAQLLIEELK